MARKTFTAIVMMLIVMTAQGKKPRVIEQPEWLSSSCGKSLTVTRVEITDTATVLTFHSEYKPNNRILLPTFRYESEGLC